MQTPSPLSRPAHTTSRGLQVIAAAILVRTLFFRFTGAEPRGRWGVGVAELRGVMRTAGPQRKTRPRHHDGGELEEERDSRSGLRGPGETRLRFSTRTRVIGGERHRSGRARFPGRPRKPGCSFPPATES